MIRKSLDRQARRVRVLGRISTVLSIVAIVFGVAAIVLSLGCAHSPYPACRDHCYQEHPSGPGLGLDPWSQCMRECCGTDAVRTPGGVE